MQAEMTTYLKDLHRTQVLALAALAELMAFLADQHTNPQSSETLKGLSNHLQSEAENLLQHHTIAIPTAIGRKQ